MRSLLGAVLLAGTAASSSALSAETIEHVVEPGETLWAIAAQSDVYGDPYLWPVIYKFNRDQIKDPAQIYPKQTLIIPIDIDAATKAEAREEAKGK
jgi:nucleoid-associated protein YgaU